MQRQILWQNYLIQFPFHFNLKRIVCTPGSFEKILCHQNTEKKIVCLVEKVIPPPGNLLMVRHLNVLTIFLLYIFKTISTKYSIYITYRLNRLLEEIYLLNIVGQFSMEYVLISILKPAFGMICLF